MHSLLCIQGKKPAVNINVSTVLKYKHYKLYSFISEVQKCSAVKLYRSAQQKGKLLDRRSGLAGSKSTTEVCTVYNIFLCIFFGFPLQFSNPWPS